MTLPNPLQQLYDLDKSSPQLYNQLRNIFSGKEYRECVPHLQDDDLVRLVEYLDGVLDHFDPMTHAFRISLHELRRICGARETLPKSSTIPDSLQIGPSVDPGYAQEGMLSDGKVRVKRVRVYSNEDPRMAKKAFNQLAVMWKRLNHPNIVPLLGATIDPPQLVSDWMLCGDLVGYIVDHADADRLGLLYDVAEGLNYLHSCNVIHGGLKGPNILVNVNGRALITDPGLAMITQYPDSVWSASDECAGSVRWIAPEVLGGWGTYSKEGDVFSLAMVAIEIFTGAVPFVDSPPAEALLFILEGRRPPRPTDRTLTDRLWELTRRCWDQEAHLRPRVSEVLDVLRGFDIPAWRRLISRPRATDEHISLVTNIFSDDDEIQVVKGLREDDAQVFIDVIDEASYSLPQPQQKECLRALRRICGRQGLLPRSLQISFSYNRSGTTPYRGGSADVWMGEHQGRDVAVKVLRIFPASKLDKIARRFCKEAVTWKLLHHPNVLSLLGATMANCQFVMVSEWMINGNINEFIEAHQDANRYELLKDVVRGLIYMHGEGMIHGDLKGANILIDSDCRARLADFGLTTVVSDPLNPTVSISSTGGGTAQWMSPELFDPDQFGLPDSRLTKESDYYALGMVIYEVLSGKFPFASFCDAAIVWKVTSGERPKRPLGNVWFTDELWKTLELCWVAHPERRPRIEAVFECLERVSRPPPGMGDELSSTASGFSNRSIIQGGNQSSVPSDSRPSSASGPTTGREVLQRRTGNSSSRGVGSARLAIASEDIEDESNPDRTGSLKGPEISSQLSIPSPDQGGSDPKSIRREASVWESANGNLSPKQSRQYTSPPLDGNKLSQYTQTPLDEDPVPLMDYLENVLSKIDATSPVFLAHLRELRKICGTWRTLPWSYTLPGLTLCIDDQPTVWGYCGNVHKGFINGSEVRVKKLFVSPDTARQGLTKDFYEEVVTWKYLNHPNIVPLRGITFTPSPQLVSGWIPGRNLTEYIKNNPGADRLGILCDVANALEYLHSNGVVHGNLGAPNILVDDSDQVQITDFGLATMPRDPDSKRAFVDDQTVQWTAPEILNDRGTYSKEADVFSFAMVMVEVFTGAVPFGANKPSMAGLAIMQGDRPPRPVHPMCSDKLWKIMQRCWNQEPHLRPEVSEVLNVLRGLSRSPPAPVGFLARTATTIKKRLNR